MNPFLTVSLVISTNSVCLLSFFTGNRIVEEQDGGFQIPLVLLVEKQVGKHKDKTNTATVKHWDEICIF